MSGGLGVAALGALGAFRDGLLARLERFAHEAYKDGLHGVRPPERLWDDDAAVEVRLRLNGWELVILSPNQVLYSRPEDWTRNALTAKLLVYLAGVNADLQDPHFEVAIQEREPGQYHCGMRSLGGGLAYPMAGDGFTTREEHTYTAEDRGNEASNLLIDHFYGTFPVWDDPPTLGELRGTTTPRRPIGFATGPKEGA